MQIKITGKELKATDSIKNYIDTILGNINTVLSTI